MAADDLRAFLRALAAVGEMIQNPALRDSASPRPAGSSRVDRNGDPAIEYPPPAGGLGRRVVGLHGSARRIAMALGLPPNCTLAEQASIARRRLGRRVDAQYVAPSAAACKQVILRGTAIDLRSLEGFIETAGQVPHLEKVLLATRDPDSGAIGLTVAALHPQGPTVAMIHAPPESPFSRHRAAAPGAGGALKVAALLGNDPSLPLLALMPLASEEDAYLCASALREEALVITDCESTDLEIPARGEIVLEGLVAGTSTAGGRPEAPLLTIHTMTHRRDPIFEVQPDGDRGAEARLLASWAAASQVATESKVE